MANVRFFEYSKVGFDAIKNTADKHTFYLVGDATNGYDLYIGDKKLNEAAEIAAAVETLSADIDTKATQEALNALSARVDSITSGGEGENLTTLRAAIDKVAEDLGKEVTRASGAEAALDERLETAEGTIQTQGSRLDAAEGNISSLQTAVGDANSGLVKNVADLQTSVGTLETNLTEEINRAKGVEGGLRTDVDAIKGDYLKGSDKETLEAAIANKADTTALNNAKSELEGKINAKADATALETEIARAKAAEEKNASDIALILDNPSTDAVDSIKEFISYVEEHGEVVVGLQTAIDDNAEAIATEKTRAEGAETALSGRLDVLEAIDFDAYEGADAALKTELEGKINAKAAQADLEAEVSRATGAENALSGRITTLEGKFTGDNSVEKQIESAVATAAQDATNKANKALEDANAYTDTEVGKVAGRVTTIENTLPNKADKSALETVSTQVNTNKTDIATIKGSLETLQSSLSSYATIAYVDAEVKKVDDKVTAHGTRLDTAEGNISALQTALTWQVANQ